MNQINQSLSNCHVQNGKAKLLSLDKIPLSNILTGQELQDIIDAESSYFRNRIFDPLTSSWTFVNQILSEDQSCRHAVNQLILKRSLEGNKICSSTTSSYCEARKRVTESFFEKLAKLVGYRIDQSCLQEWKWHGKNIKLVDGTTVIAPDTKENQLEYPQNPAQAKGLGNPIIRIVGIFSLATGALLEAGIAPYAGKGSGETTLFRGLIDKLSEEDLLLLDRYYSGFIVLYALLQRKVDFVVRQSPHRKIDFRTGIKLGKDDHLIKIKKCSRYGFSGTDEEYDQAPNEITLREVKIKVKQKGFREKEMILLTSLTDGRTYSKDDLANLYKQRWNVEVDFRSIKSDLNMDQLRCKTPAMLRKEIWAHFLAYNLIRNIQLQCCYIYRKRPRELSLKATQQAFAIFRIHLAVARKDERSKMYSDMLESISKNIIGKRPDRYEPRLIKTRGSQHQLMTVPREEARKQHWPKKKGVNARKTAA